MYSKKGQSSVEYLGTYAWAFIGLIVTIGALNYFGILSPEKYTPETCESGSQIQCQDIAIYHLASSDQSLILFMFQNNYPKNITVESVELVDIGTWNKNYVVEPGRTVTIDYKGNTNFVIGEKEKISFEITYKRFGGGQSHTITGTANINVQKSPETNLNNIYYCGGKFIQETGRCDLPDTIDSGITDYDNVQWPPAEYCSGNSYCRSDCTCA